jgi:prepilin-type N-terminal cleavage/methylation domain-containing protein/prepilin-type processing-associated H-X9-DG protein
MAFEPSPESRPQNMVPALGTRPKQAIEVGAFTLTELLVVIAILGILAALLLPALSMAKSYSRSATCRNHLHQMGIALKMYVDDHQSTFPFYLGPAGPSYGDATYNGKDATGLVYWSSKLFPYYSLNWTNSLFHCPGYMGKNTGPYPETGATDVGKVERLGSYGYNMDGSSAKGLIPQNFGLGPIIFWNTVWHWNVPPVTESRIKVPSDMLAIGESRLWTGNESGGDTLGPGNLAHLFNPARHGRNYNLLLCDGHVSSLRPMILFNPTNSASMWNYDHQPHSELW